MKVYYNFNWNPFCHACGDVMHIDVSIEEKDEAGLFKRVAHCKQAGCSQQGFRFVIPPLSAEIEREINATS